ncbi:MAG TPA: formylglycine-generating enzyme family protein [Candidatus Hydrogenedens sp.]|nr:formylglycine-generating enzyme family protein [Candidatus Hydrogenedens sp.]
MTLRKNVAIFTISLLFLTPYLYAQHHSADYKPPFYVIQLSELLRVIQIYNYGSYHCSPGSEDGYALGPGNNSCQPHNSDYNPQNWQISFDEVLRLVQLYKSDSYKIDSTGEDGFQLGTATELTPGTKSQFLGITFVWIPSGSFYMGTTKSPNDLVNLYGGTASLYTSEYPQHLVVISRGFWMSETEITQQQWQNIMGYNNSNNKGDNLPVENLTWEECQKFIDKINTMGSGTFRLPTEAEWEYACRAGSTTEFYFGDDASQLDNYGWHYNNSNYQTHPVGQKLPNAWGLYDMHGNVWEWCQDWYDANYYQYSPSIDPNGPASGKYKVLRGGTCLRTSARCRSAFRSWNAPDLSMPDQGFRICKMPD